MAGDIESNPGPRPTYTCRVCRGQITSSRNQGGSVRCSQCEGWVHYYVCSQLTNLNQYDMHTWCYPICTSNQPLPFVANNPAQQPAVAGAPPLQPPPTVTPTPLPTNITQSNYRHHNINVLQYNIDGLNLKHSQLKDYMSKNNIHIATLQETKIKPHHVHLIWK